MVAKQKKKCDLLKYKSINRNLDVLQVCSQAEERIISVGQDLEDVETKVIKFNLSSEYMSLQWMMMPRPKRK